MPFAPSQRSRPSTLMTMERTTSTARFVARNRKIRFIARFSDNVQASGPLHGRGGGPPPIQARTLQQASLSHEPRLSVAHRFFAACLSLFAMSAALAQQPGYRVEDVPAWFTDTFLDFPEDVRDAAKQGKRLLLYFGQDGCPYCRELMVT